MSARKKLSSAAIAVVSKGSDVASSSVSSSSAPQGRLVMSSKRQALVSQKGQVNEIQRILGALFADEAERNQIAECRTASGDPLFTLKTKGALLDVRAIHAKLGFDKLMEYLKTVSSADEIARTSPLLEQAQIQLRIEDELAERRNENISEGKYECPKAGCKSKKIGFRQMQTRSGDEGSTTFLRCTVCNERWKERG
jgi:DNA-directed RNA polymerase subunit M/transcription elongation factor TFIIS